jgi:hypothetical protein
MGVRNHKERCTDNEAKESRFELITCCSHSLCTSDNQSFIIVKGRGTVEAPPRKILQAIVGSPRAVNIEYSPILKKNRDGILCVKRAELSKLSMSALRFLEMFMKHSNV